MRILAVVCASIALAWASAWSLPADAQVFLTAADGTIVGVGTSSGGTVFELDLLAGFEGEVRLLVIGAGADPQVVDAMVIAGIVYVDDVDLAVVVRTAGFVDVSVEASGSAGGPSGSPRGRGLGVADQVRSGPGNANGPREETPGPNERANERAQERADEKAEDRANDDPPANPSPPRPEPRRP